MRSEMSPPVNNPKGIHFSYKLSGDLTKDISKQFAEVALRHLQALVSFNNLPNGGLRDVFRYQASTLFDGIIFHLATFDFTTGRTADAAVYFGALSDRIRNRSDVPPETARDIHWAHGMCLVQRSQFPGNKPPISNDLVTAISEVEKAISIYGDELPFLYNVCSRDHFFSGDLNKALDYADRALAIHSDAVTRMNSLLNRAVLKLLIGDMFESAKSFYEFLKCPTIQGLNWDDLIAFADYTVSEAGHRNGIFLQAFYRHLTREPISSKLKNALDVWFAVDSTRVPLTNLYKTAQPLVQVPTGAPSKQKSKAKQPKKKNRSKKKR